MKKIIGILGVAVIAATMFFSANNVTGSGSDVSLASLIGINSANAEDDEDGGTTFWVKKHFDCKITIQGNAGAVVTVWGQKVKIPLNGSITLTSNLGVDCDRNGPSQCTVFDCHQI